MSVDWRNFAIIFVIGIILISVAAAIALYPRSVISAIQNSLNSGQLPQQDVYAQQGSLSWWKLALTQTYEPIASIISSAGLLTLALSLVYGCLAVNYGLIKRKTIRDQEPPKVEKEKKEVQVGGPSPKKYEEEPQVISNSTIISTLKETRKAENGLRFDYEQGTIEEYRWPEKPTSESTAESSRPKSRPTGLWYLVAFLFGLIGGLVGYVAVKENDPEMARGLLSLGLLTTVVGGILIWLLYGWIFS